MERKILTESDVVAIMPAQRRLRQEDGKFEASLGYARTVTQTKYRRKQKQKQQALAGPQNALWSEPHLMSQASVQHPAGNTTAPRKSMISLLSCSSVLRLPQA